MDFSADNPVIWDGVIQFGWICLILLVGNLVRRKIRWFRQALLPTSVIAGFLGLLLVQTGLLRFDQGFLNGITYHTIAIGFIALGLRIPRRKDVKRHGATSHDGTKTGMLIVSNYLIQGVLGLVTMIVLAHTFLPGTFEAAGLLLPMGYGQGPGQANNIGSVYENIWGFTGGQSFGLALATAGFLWASIGGIFYLNILQRQNKLPAQVAASPKEQGCDIFEDPDEIPLTEAVDRLTIQIALVMSIYLLTFLISLGVVSLFDLSPALAGAKKTISPLIWGFNFLIGSSLALGIRGSLQRLRQIGWMTRQYPNSYLLNRISGFAFDLMITASIISIQIDDLQGLWIPFILMSTLGGVLTLAYNVAMARRLYPDYPVAGMLSMYGMMTGTVSTGILSLRQVD
ncbi:MAG: sodium:glutamate symporter, partial [Clostridia bacterium]|nr:sodium:glutamate symporter [Clostridia bacterium]